MDKKFFQRRSIRQGGDTRGATDGVTLPGGDPGKASLGQSEFESAKGMGGVAIPSRAPLVEQPSASEITKVWNVNSWLQRVPWEQVTFYRREVFKDVPDFAGVWLTELDIYQEIVPKLQCLVLTSIIWRGLCITPLGLLEYVIDWPLFGSAAAVFRSEFQITLSGSQPADHLTDYTTALGPLYYSRGYTILNQNILNPSCEAALVIPENITVRCFGINMVYDYGSYTGYAYDGAVGVELEGFWMPMQLLNQIRSQPSL